MLRSGVQIPWHSADAWRRHWDEHPVLPDEIFIKAQQRAMSAEKVSVVRANRDSINRLANDEEDEDPPASSRKGARRHVSDEEGENEDDDEEDDNNDGDDDVDEDEDEDDATEDEYSQEEERVGYYSGQKGLRKRRVTDEDKRAMAKHMAANWKHWEDMTGAQRWKEFAARPEVRPDSMYLRGT